MSGSGKTTLLRIISGLELPDSGSVHFHGSEATDVSVRERRVGFVFQHYALFRHMSVADNIEFALKVRHVAAPERLIGRVLPVAILATRPCDARGWGGTRPLPA